MYVSPDADSIKECKKQLRSKYRALRGGIPDDMRAEMDRKIRENLLSSDEYKNCGVLLAYVSVSDEADTRGIISSAFSDGKTVAVPRCVNGAGDMLFYVIDSFEQLEEGAFSIPEPSAEKCSLLERFAGAVCIVPALAYDNGGCRLGYGGGYYDRFLSSHREIYSIGIEYSCCTEASLVRDSHDIAVDMLITENYVRIIKNRRHDLG